jgi:prepilin-type N-terminal cleavage/methylation domain-containing protein
MTKLLPKKIQGFTLIELLVVIGVLTVLLAIVLVAINPARQFAQANNTQRRSDVSAILNAVHQYGAENKGDYSQLDSANGLPSTATAVSSVATDLCDDLTPTYIAEMPYDPTTGSYTDCATYDTGYTIVASTDPSGARVTVSAPDAELSETISVTR